MTGKGYRQRRLPLGAWRIPALALATLYVALAAVLPAAVLLWTSFFGYALPLSATAADFSLEAYRQLFANRDVLAGIAQYFAGRARVRPDRDRHRRAARLDHLAVADQVSTRARLRVGPVGGNSGGDRGPRGDASLSVAADRSLRHGVDFDHRLFLSLRHHHAARARGLYADSQGARGGLRRLGRALDRRRCGVC